MKGLLIASALTLTVGGFVGCANGDDIVRGGPRSDWSRVQTDVVCNSVVDPRSAYAVEYNDRYYYFHSEECARKFRDNPTAFTVPRDERRGDDRRPDDRDPYPDPIRP